MPRQSRYGTRRAINELRAIFACQWRNGMLPQIRFMPAQAGYRPDADDWAVPPQVAGPTRLRTSGITQPPIIGLCAEVVFRKISDEERAAHSADFLALLDGLDAYHDWLLRERDPRHENLALCLHPWETGTDNSPAFDPLIEATRDYIEAERLLVETFGRADTVHVKQAHRPTARDYFAYFGLLALYKQCAYDQQAIIERSPFLLQDVLFNTLLAASLGSTARLADALADGYAPREAARLREAVARNRERAGVVAEAIRRKLWDADDGLFYSYDSRGERLLRTATVSSLMPLMSGVADDEQAGRLLARLRDPAMFWTRAPVPSTAANAPVFNPERYWSGPSWPVTNWLVLRGLDERGSDLAGPLRESSLRMIAEGAEREQARAAAVSVLEQNSFGEDFTTPSTRQYAHAWLWDSAIVAASWPLVTEKPPQRPPQPTDPGFWEYYDPRTGVPLGAAPMTWTASLFLEMLERSA
ncbi:MAG: MGH1-like glycoside hydrolase domain-containing protein [Chloroflexia bacterium]